MSMETEASDLAIAARLPRVVIASSAILLALGAASCLTWWHTGDVRWIRGFFAGPGAIFFIACSILQAWLSLRCWRGFSRGDLLRPAWLLIFAAALAGFAGALLNQIFGSPSALNPLALLPPASSAPLVHKAAEIGPLCGPLQMLLLACGLSYVLKACRRNGILGRLMTLDLALVGLVVVYTGWFFATIVFASEHGGRSVNAEAVISWASDPLLCVLLFQAILIRRSTANMGFGLISRCWLSFTAAIFLTSLGDISLWAWSRGYLPYPLVVASWFVWFLPSAAYALGPAYQLIAMLSATRADAEAFPAEAAAAGRRNSSSTR